MKNYKTYKFWRFICLVSLSLILLLSSIIPIRLAIAFAQTPQPQAFFVLGGDPARENFVAKIAPWYPGLEIWVSSGPNPQKTREIFQAAGIPKNVLHIDSRAIDTVTNFTSLVADFKKKRIQHLYLVTSDYHLPRALAIATIVLGSQQIAFTPMTVPSNQPPEALSLIWRDVGRSVLWIFTGDTGYGLMNLMNRVKNFLATTVGCVSEA